ncbi:TauD/TfdA family dioxygenase [Croceitalea rosinachiae]|uniref:TauD/TfdA family dioxygenase n=1 Tax=Croceitalea rosinachiae TaxID=3075596 RepID=A0ABU3ACD3_9FLAO|nr:TauD/TfdA family dioxygenase [Croceitalea sp. F388]MDT0607840.1 TauD/TfdA family dioxygenase [Croceitalea sp. F388]
MEFITDLKLRTNDPIEAAEIVKQGLKNFKVIKIVPEWYLGDLRAFYDTLIDNVGEPFSIGEDFTNKEVVSTGEKWLEIRYDADIPDMAAYRHSKNAQPLHTDGAYATPCPDIMAFYCINKAIQGGATTFIDGPVLVDFMKENAPELLDRVLNSEELHYSKAEKSRKQKIIEIGSDGEIRFNFNYYCIDPNESEENKKLNQDFFDFLQSYVAHSHMAKKVVLNPGEGVLWWDDKVIHGRTSYEAKKTNDRFIWKTGFNWKD